MESWSGFRKREEEVKYRKWSGYMEGEEGVECVCREDTAVLEWVLGIGRTRRA